MMLDVATKDGRFSVVVVEMVVALVAETAVAVVAETAVAVETAGVDYTFALKPYRYR